VEGVEDFMRRHLAGDSPGDVPGKGGISISMGSTWGWLEGW